MKLTLKRDIFTAQSTSGQLFVDGVFECYTLELPLRDGKPGSAIPTGNFPVRIEPSPRFGRYMPRLYDIPGRSAILIHWGNRAADDPETPEIEKPDTEGCILVGQSRDEDFVGQSKLAFEALFSKLVQSNQAAIEIAEDHAVLGVEESIGG